MKGRKPEETPMVAHEGLPRLRPGDRVAQGDGGAPLEDHVASHIGGVGRCPVRQEAVGHDDVAGLEPRHHHLRACQELLLTVQLDLPPVHRRVPRLAAGTPPANF